MRPIIRFSIFSTLAIGLGTGCYYVARDLLTSALTGPINLMGTEAAFDFGQTDDGYPPISVNLTGVTVGPEQAAAVAKIAAPVLVLATLLTLTAAYFLVEKMLECCRDMKRCLQPPQSRESSVSRDVEEGYGDVDDGVALARAAR